MQVKSIEEHVRASAEYKLGVANQSITAGFFDDNTRLVYESIDFTQLFEWACECLLFSFFLKDNSDFIMRSGVKNYSKQ